MAQILYNFAEETKHFNNEKNLPITFCYSAINFPI